MSLFFVVWMVSSWIVLWILGKALPMDQTCLKHCGMSGPTAECASCCPYSLGDNKEEQ
jgi:hypothetical protein